MSRISQPGFWILLAIGLLDVVVLVLPLTSLAIIFCLLFYPAGIGYAGRWLSRLYEDMSREKTPGGHAERSDV
jgi:hypothetical protein